MTKLNVNTSKVKTLGENMVKISNSFYSDVNSLYNRVYKVPMVTREWVGVASNNYASILLKEKTQYVNYANSLKEMGNILIDYATDIEQAIKNTKIS